MAATVTERKTSKASQERKFQDTSKLLRRERSKYLRHKFQQVVVQALLKKGDEGEDTNIEANSKGQDGCPIIPQEINTSLNLSRTNLKEFPIGLLDRLQHVEYLYLEEAKLTELPQNFFQKLPSLKWLDLRNNALVSLPIMGLRNHPNLEVILLQGNRIRNLPIELATIPFLKGLQTTGNPLTNVPYDCVAQGFSGIMNHLKKLCAQSEVLAPVSETILVKPSTSQDLLDDTLERPLADSVDSDTKLWDSDKLSQWRQFMKKKSNNSNTELQNLAAFNEKRPMQKPKVSVKIRGYPKTPLKAIPFRCGTYSKNRQRSTIATAQNNIRMKKTRLGYKRKPITLQMVEERARKNAHVAQVRETLEKQARKIQRMRDKEVLKSWRDHARITRNQMKLLDNYQQYPSRDFANKTPFDVDPEFLNMLNRVDLYRSLRDYDNRSKKVKQPKIRITALDLERQMNEIMQKLQNLDTGEPDTSTTPDQGVKEAHLCHKMSKIWDIQKTLKQLQKLNSSMPGITPLGVPKKMTVTNTM